MVIKLFDYLKKMMYVGFYVSKEGSAEIHLIENWDYQTFGFTPIRPKSHMHNVSNNSMIITPRTPVSNSINTLHKNLG